MKRTLRNTLRISFAILLPCALTLLYAGCDIFGGAPPGEQQNIIEVPDGFSVEKVVGGLNLATSVTWDDQGRMYVAEAGGGLNVEQKAPSRILRIEGGEVTKTINLTDQGVFASVVGLVWHDGKFFITHRDQESLTGAVSTVTMDGEVTELFSGIIDSQAEHQINAIEAGPNGKMFVTVGPAGNAGVVGPSIIPWLKKSPDVHTTPCQDIVLEGRNFKTADFRTQEQGDSVKTGAYVPFGESTAPGQRIEGTNKCGGSILAFDPQNPEGTLDWYAWGFRNALDITFSNSGAMYLAENGYDVRGARPVNDEIDATLRVEEGQWYGVPDFSAGREPLTDERFESPDSLQAQIFIDGAPIGKDLGFLIDHEASGLTPPDPSVVVGRHAINSSPSGIDTAPDSWGDMAGDLFMAEWGDLAPPTNPLRGQARSGFQVSHVDPEAGGDVQPFARNRSPAPASAQGAQGRGFERPFDVRFGPDGAMYIVDYGKVTINMALKPPYQFGQNTGAIWKVTPTH